MESHHQRLEMIKAKRISLKERVQSLLIFIGMLIAALVVSPIIAFYLGINVIYFFVSGAAGHAMVFFGYVFLVVIGLLLIVVVYYLMSNGQSYLTRCLSGIREK